MSLIQIKRSANVTAPTTTILEEGELAYSYDKSNNGVGAKLYIEVLDSGDSEVIHVIGGKYYTDIVDSANSNAVADTLVKRDSLNNFSANVITANIFQGSIASAAIADTANTLTTGRVINLAGDLEGNVTFDGSTDVTIYANVINNSVTLGTDTTGDYVANILAGDGIKISNQGGETAIPTIELTTTGVTAGVYGGVSKTLVSLDIDDQGRILAASNVSLGDIVLGNDTSGDYVSNVLAGTGVIISNQGGETATPTIAIGQDVATTADVQFAKVNTTGQVRITDTTESSSPETGALIILGGVGIGGNVNISGNLNVLGSVTTFSANDLIITDPLIYIGEDNTGDVLDLGFVASFTNGYYQHTGLVRDASDGIWKLFANVVQEPAGTIDFTDATYSTLKIGSLQSATGTFTGNVETGNVSGTAGTFTYSRLGTVESGTWNGTSISTTYTDAKIKSVSNVGPVSVVDTSGDVSVGLLNSGVTPSTYGGTNVFGVFTVDQYGIVTSAANVSLDASSINIANTNITGLIIDSQIASVSNTKITGLITDSQIDTVANTKITGLITDSQIASVSASKLSGDVVLGTQTSGAYVANLIQGAGIDLTGLGDEGATPTIALATSGVSAATYGGTSDIPVIAIDTYGRITSASNVSISTNLSIAGDTGTDSVSLASETLRVIGGTGIGTSAASNTITITNLGVTGLSGTTNEITVSAANGSVQIGMPDDVTVGNNLTVTGNLFVLGTATTVDVGRLSIEDPLVKFGNANPSDALDIGFFGSYVSGGSKVTGLFRDASDSGKFKLFYGLESDPDSIPNVVDTSGAGYTVATLVANLTGGTVSGLTAPIAVADGGIGLSSLTQNGILYGNTTSVVGFATGSVGQFLQLNNSGVPVFAGIDGGTY